MRPQIIIGTALVVLIFLAGVPAEKSRFAVDRDQEGESADGEFSLDAGVFSLNILRECLDSFKKLTAEARGKIPEAKMKEIGNTGWEMQTLGFSNHPGYLEGTLLKQDVTIKRLQWELVRLKVKEGASGENDLLEAQKALEISKKSFEEFKARFRVKD